MSIESTSKIISQFFYATTTPARCSVPTENMFAAHTACLAVLSAAKHWWPDAEQFSPFCSGSLSELYVQPLMTCIGDVDLMMCSRRSVVQPRGLPVPRTLPEDCWDAVKLMEYHETHFAGYVLMTRRGLLSRDGHVAGGEYTFFPVTVAGCASNNVPDLSGTRHGPAFVHDVRFRQDDDALLEGSHFVLNISTVDMVFSVRCLVWPPQAVSWSTRYRRHGWPDHTMIARIVSSGCHLVPVSHHQSRNVKFWRDGLWRLSFSAAETTLLDSTSHPQQLTYHMLRYFTKRMLKGGRFREDGRKIISNYNIKTLVMWAAELKAADWWNSDNLVAICRKLLHTLAMWLESGTCQHYFIVDCNLLQHDAAESTVIRQLVDELRFVSDDGLANWFLVNYVRVAADKFHDRASVMFDDAQLSVRERVSTVVYWSRQVFFPELSRRSRRFFDTLLDTVEDYSDVNLRQFLYLKNEFLQRVHPCFEHCVLAVAYLHVAVRLSLGDTTILISEMMDVLPAFCCLELNCHGYNTDSIYSRSSAHSAEVLLRKGCHQLRHASTSAPSSVQRALAIIYLQRVLPMSEESGTPGLISVLANAYLAAIYYTEGQHELAADHCRRVMESGDGGKVSSDAVVAGDVITGTDASMDAVLGVSRLYEYIRTTALPHSVSQEVHGFAGTFSVDLFTSFLLLRCSQFLYCNDTAKHRSKYAKMFIAHRRPVMSDVLLYKMAVYTRLVDDDIQTPSKRPRIESVEVRLFEALRSAGLEHLVAFRRTTSSFLVDRGTVILRDLEAMYLYERGDFRSCLRLCYASLKHFALNQTLSVTQFIALNSPHQLFLRNDVTCVSGLFLLRHPDVAGRLDRTFILSISQVGLLFYLMIECLYRVDNPPEKTVQLVIKEVRRYRRVINHDFDTLMFTLIYRKAMILLRSMGLSRHFGTRVEYER